MSVIYCVVPEALADELFPKLESYTPMTRTSR